MHIHSDSFEHRQPIPADFAMGAPGSFGGNRNPHLAWGDVPEGTRSFVLLCIDSDVPTDPALVADAGTPIPVEHPRGDFVHWAVADIPADVRAIAAGSCSDGIAKGGKPAGRDAGGVRGLNDYTGWFAG
ncbi:MAG TPA: YbhB/YbcL family Raf kinase inhibitor-like protein, partial [Thermomonas sp.]|nr:YbhB/YbcL family Raf kinase inhibitor-like protein [Thermomonas sp.]